MIWVARSITEEYAATLEQLNENTIADVGFFGIEFETLREEGAGFPPGGARRRSC